MKSFNDVTWSELRVGDMYVDRSLKETCIVVVDAHSAIRPGQPDNPHYVRWYEVVLRGGSGNVRENWAQGDKFARSVKLIVHIDHDR